MSAAKHTPAPWEVHYSKDGAFEIHDMPECFESTVLCSRYPYVERKDEFEANARLIAAAPDLLEALKCAVGGCASPALWLNHAHAAIGKATGETA